MLSRGVSPELARQWIEVCYPAQIRLVLNNPAWQKYEGDELARMGIRGVRGKRKTILESERKMQMDSHQSRVARNRELKRQRELANNPQAQQEQQSAKLAILDDFM